MRLWEGLDETFPKPTFSLCPIVFRENRLGTFILRVLRQFVLPRARTVDYCTPRTDQTDHDLDHIDHLVPHLPLREVVQDLHSTDPTQETCATAVNHADHTAPRPAT